MYDTAGQDRFRSIVSSYYRGSHGIVLVFDLTDRSSFEKISNWVEEIKHNSPKSVKLLLVGNKCDLKEERKVSESEAKQIAQHLACGYEETSAKTDENIDEMIFNFSKFIFNENHSKDSSLKVNQAESLNFNSFGKMISCGSCSIL